MKRTPPPSQRQRDLAYRYARDAAETFDVCAGDIMGRCRFPEVARARRAVMQRLAADGYPVGMIGRMMQRHPSSVSVALKGGKGQGA